VTRRPAGSARRQAWRSPIAVGAVVVVLTAVLVAASSSSHRSFAAGGLAGSAGTDISLPLTDSKVTVSGRNDAPAGGQDLSGLQVTVNQTKDLVNQAISITWTGAPPTWSSVTKPAFFRQRDANYLQIFQCWGEDDGTGGPPPEQCQFGGERFPTTGPPDGLQTGSEYTRTLSQSTWTCGAGTPPGCKTYAEMTALANSDPSRAYLDPKSHYVLDPFKAVDGTLVPATVDYNYCAGPPCTPSPFITNPYFDYTNTNEIASARTYPDANGDGKGSGQALFQVNSGLESPGLGCGQKVQKKADGSLGTPTCWLVIVPRGTPSQENMTGSENSGLYTNTSPLTSSAWRNRIAVKLDFQPIETACTLGADQRRIAGSELAARAVANWQPTLCERPGSSPYSYESTSDDQARTQLLSSASTGGIGMAVVSRPVDPSVIDPGNPLVYAPLALSGAVIGFNIQRQPALGTGNLPLPDQLPLAGTGITKLNLTPRLVAKLLTSSYQDQFFNHAVQFPTKQFPSGWDDAHAFASHNPRNLLTDPEFLRYNPEFSELSIFALEASGLVLEQPSSDAAYEVWQWVLGDPEAKQWLDGQPDPWGAKVNAYFSTDPAANPSGLGLASQPLSNFPKNDPYCYTPQPGGQDLAGLPPNTKPARPLCFTDWSPYVSSMRDAAAATRSTRTGAKSSPPPDDSAKAAATENTYWRSNPAQENGFQVILSVTDTAHASQFGLQSAMLSHAGDDGTSRAFVAPDALGLLAGVGAMVSSGVPGVLVANPVTTAAAAYPLTMLTYAATAPVGLDASARTDYAAFVSFAAGPGQVPGTSFGTLPLGYVPLPAPLAAQATAAAQTILNPPSPSAPPTSPPTSGVSPRPTSSASAPGPGALPVTAGAQVASEGTAPGAGAPATSSTPEPVATPSSLAKPELAVVRTASSSAGMARFAVPIGFAVGLLSMLGAWVLGRGRRRRPA